MNAFATRWLFSTNHKDIGTLYMIFGFFSGMIGTIVSIMLLAGLNVGLFYILSVLYLGICFSIFSMILGFSVDLREAVFFTGLEVLCLLCFEIQSFIDFANSIGEFVKQCVHGLGTDLLVVYYQISCLILLLESFSTWYWFTTITIVLLPWLAMKRHPSNFMLIHNLFGCMQPLLLALRSVAFLGFGCCFGLGSLLIPVAECGGPDNGSGEESPSHLPSPPRRVEGESSNSSQNPNYHTPVKRGMPDAGDANGSVLKRQRVDTSAITPSGSVLSGDNTPHLTSPVLRHHINFTGTGRFVFLNSICANQTDRDPCVTVVSTLSAEEMRNITLQEAGPRSNVSEPSSNDDGLFDYPVYGSGDTSPDNMSPNDPRKRTLDILRLPVAEVIDPNVQHLEVVSDGPFRRRLFTSE